MMLLRGCELGVDRLLQQYASNVTELSLQGGMDKKRLHYIEGGHHGNREHFINNLVQTMN